ncbi:MAG: fibronectin type III domain-containing protein [Candidatus Shapirobacteria bacterium]
MRGASKIKTVILVVIMGMVVILGILGMDTVKTYMSGATADFQPSEVTSNVTADGRSVTISWKTTKESRGYVEYGTTPASLLLRSEIDGASGSLSHSVVLTPLKVNINYYFRIRAGEDEAKKSEWEVFDNAGIPFSFNTKVGSGIERPIGGGENREEILPTAPVVQPMPTNMLTVTPPVVKAGCESDVDYNHDGVTNSIDIITCFKTRAGTALPTTVSATTPVIPLTTITVTPAGTVKAECSNGTDFDGNGVVNSLDVIKCLQGR